MNALVRIIWSFSLKRPALLAAVFSPLAVLAFGFALEIEFEDSLRSVFASKSTAFSDYVSNSRSFSQTETEIAILVSSPEPFDGPALEALRDFLLEIQFVDEVGAVFSVFSLSERNMESGEINRLLPNDLSDAKLVADRLSRIAADDSLRTRLISQDLRETVIVVSLGTDMARLAGPSKALDAIRGLSSETARLGGLDFRMTGLLLAREEIISGLKSDQYQINILGAFLGFLASTLLFRSFIVAGINVVAPLSALLFCLGAFGWFGFSINALTNALPVLILVLATSDSIHMSYEIRRRMAAGARSIDALRGAVADIAPPCVLTSLTTIMAFASLIYSDSPVVRDLAYAGCAGVFIALMSVLFIHPAVVILAARLPLFERALRAPLPEFRALGEPLFASVVRRSRLVVMGGIALTAASFLALWPIETEYRIMENIDADRPIAVTLDRVEAITGPMGTIEIPLQLRDQVTLDDPRVARDLDALAQGLVALDGVRSVVSLRDLGPFGDWTGALADLPPQLRHKLISRDGRQLRITLQVEDDSSQAVIALAGAADRVMQTTDTEVLTPRRATGFLVMTAVLSDQMIRQLTISFLIAALICPVLIGAWFRSLAFGLAAVLPNILPIAAIAAMLMLTGRELQLTSALALTIAFGVALDDSIHVFNRLRLQDGRNLTQGMSHIAPVLVTTTVILSLGLAATLVSGMPMIRVFGVLCIAIFVIAAICDLILLPALLALLGRKDAKAT